jgi:ribosomal protein S18 acetylase RimI-like enzyme
MRELRPHVAPETFLARVQQQQKENFQLAFLEHNGEVRAVAGFRIMEMLFSGRTCYIDDLVTKSADRSLGFGSQLFDWLVKHAEQQRCDYFTLDSGVQRFAAHRFYLQRRMEISAHHFSLKL